MSKDQKTWYVPPLARLMQAPGSAKLEDRGPTTSAARRQMILDEVSKCVLQDRNAQYGDPEDNFADTAALWSAYKGVEFSRADIAVMMILLKVARLRATSDNLDTWVDIAGYAACGYGSAVKDGEER